MGLYARHVLPKLIEAACGQKPMSELRAQFVPRLGGRVLEIGFGTGHNLRHYADGDARPKSLDALEPASEIVALASERIAAAPFPVRVHNASAEAVPVEDAAFDAVLTTWTLCSIPNVHRALAELRRVLAPRGRLVFIEHGASPERKWLRWQRRLDPAWKCIAGGCHLAREPDRLIADAGFRIDELQTSYLPGPKFATFTYRGVATRR